MGINTTILPDDSPYIPYSYNFSINICSDLFAVIPQVPGNFLYMTAVYNLAGDTLLSSAVDQTGQQFFKQAQQKYQDRKSTRLNSSHIPLSRMPSSA